jgi:uncharacterized protein (DUF3084 family)
MSDKKQSNSQENKSELATAKEELATAKQELKDAKQEVKDAKQELATARAENNEFDIGIAKESVSIALSGVGRCEEATRVAQDRVNVLVVRANAHDLQGGSGGDQGKLVCCSCLIVLLLVCAFLDHGHLFVSW